MIQFFKEFWLGLKSYWGAFQFIWEHRLYWYFFIPAILMLAIYFVGSFLINTQIEANLSNMNEIVWYFIHVGLNISIAILLMKFAKYIVVIMLSPLLSHLSQQCEKILTGNTYPINFKQVVSDVKRGVRLALRNVLWEYLFFLIILVISYIGWEEPTKSPIFFLTFIIGFYYYGFSFIDYDNERRKLDERSSVQFVRSHRGLAMGIGMIYSLLIWVPVDLTILFSITDPTSLSFYKIMEFIAHLMLWACASMAPILAIVSATISMNELKKQETLPFITKD